MKLYKTHTKGLLKLILQCCHLVTRWVASQSVALSVFGLAILFCYPGSLFADYTIVLKSGGRITVKSYTEEKGMFRFRALGGEIGISRQQIQSVFPTKETEPQGMVIAGIEAAEAKERLLTPEAKTAGLVAQTDETARHRRVEKDLRAEKEKGYQHMYEGVTGAIKSRTDLHWLITRGTTSPDPTLLQTLEALNGRVNDLNSRIKDAIHNPERRRGTVRLLTNSPFSGFYGTTELGPAGVASPGFVDAQPFNSTTIGNGPPGYSAAERELSDLRRQLELLYEERKRLTDVFRQEELFTGSLPYEALP